MRQASVGVPGAIALLLLSGCGNTIRGGGTDLLGIQDGWVDPDEPDPWAAAATTDDEQSPGRDPFGCKQASGIAHQDRTRLSYAAVATLAKSAGVDCGLELVKAVAVAGAESGRYQYAYLQNKNCTYDRGIWQINSYYWKDYSSYELEMNASGMVEISGAGDDWTPWAAYKNGSYKSFWSSACYAVTDLCGESYCD